jgi:hypothetical protein
MPNTLASVSQHWEKKEGERERERETAKWTFPCARFLPIIPAEENSYYNVFFFHFPLWHLFYYYYYIV